MKLEKAINWYLEDIQADGDTKRCYAHSLSKFRMSFELEPSLEEILPSQIKHYLRGMISQRSKERVAVATELHHHAALISFFNFCVKHKLLTKNPAKEVEHRKPNKDKGESYPGRRIRFLTAEQIAEVLHRVVKLRDKVILLLLYTTGKRVHEVLNIKIEDVDLKAKEIWIRHEKGNKPGITYIADLLLKPLKDYLKELETEGNFNGPLFPSGRRPGQPIRYETLYQHWRDLVEGMKNDDGTDITLHQIRHTFATERAPYMDSLLLMNLMGHKQIATTLRYAKITNQAAKQAFFDYSRIRAGKN